MRQPKNSRFFRVLAEYLKNGSTDFSQTYVTFRQVYIEVFKLKDGKSFIVAMVTNS